MSKIIKCKTCGAEIASNAKECPSCGAKNKKPIYKKVWFWIAIIVIIGGAAGGGSSTSNTQTSQENVVTNEETKTETKKQETKKEKFEIVGEITTEQDQFATYITGVIKNNTNKKYSYVQVTFNLYDADGNLLGTALDNVNNLEGDSTWKFRAMGMSEGGTIASCKLSEITGF